MSQVFIIAEAGVNYNGDLSRAIDLVHAAADAGADAVKFRTFRARDLATAPGGCVIQKHLMPDCALPGPDHRASMEPADFSGIAAGEAFSAANLTTKRPGTGLSPARWDALLGRPARRAYRRDDMIDAGEGV